ncbi:hypothetical protein SAMN05421541_108312 [Actinoplanes philippinensis]|uniref:Uncharacterized protein n=2 Tax=Actinoplanes philippinensis TaxID=35752 RepID=A0A1I2HQ91_9ACTN|nr:hypothetical protein SAMN05421541_108312 [Actinoplanes philippinensis]
MTLPTVRFRKRMPETRCAPPLSGTQTWGRPTVKRSRVDRRGYRFAMATVSYQRAVAVAAMQAALSIAWIAARELPPAKRRLARFGTAAAVTTIGWVTSPKEPEPDETEAEPETRELVVGDRPFLVSEPQPVSGGDEPAVPFDKRKAVVGAALLGLTVAAVVGRRKLEKRWLARLTRNGHPHPTRALAVRVGALEFAGQLVLQVADAHRTAARSRG